jgi:hypothetical protein
MTEIGFDFKENLVRRSSLVDAREVIKGIAEVVHDISDEDLPSIPTGGALAQLKQEVQHRVDSGDDVIEILRDDEAVSTMLGLKDKTLLPQDISKEPSIRINKTASQETRQSVENTLF